MTILVVISLILHLFTFLWIITLMQKLNAKQTSANDFEKVKSEIEDILLSYTEQMKDENEKILLQIKQIKKENDLINQKLNTETVEKIEKQPIAVQTNQPIINRKPEKKNKEPHHDYSEYVPPSLPEEKDEDIFEQSDTAKVLSLAKQGYNAEQIAKKLNLGKGEVELVLKFYQNER